MWVAIFTVQRHFSHFFDWNLFILSSGHVYLPYDEDSISFSHFLFPFLVMFLRLLEKMVFLCLARRPTLGRVLSDCCISIRAIAYSVLREGVGRALSCCIIILLLHLACRDILLRIDTGVIWFLYDC